MTAALEIKGIRKTFGDKVAIESLDLTIPQGATYGLIGPSGAGKTTMIRMVMSILFPDQGSISVFGQGSALDAKDRIGYLPEERGSYRKMTVGAFLIYMGCLKVGLAPRLPDVPTGCWAAWASPMSSPRNAKTCRRACCNGCSLWRPLSMSRTC